MVLYRRIQNCSSVPSRRRLPFNHNFILNAKLGAFESHRLTRLRFCQPDYAGLADVISLDLPATGAQVHCQWRFEIKFNRDAKSGTAALDALG